MPNTRSYVAIGSNEPSAAGVSLDTISLSVERLAALGRIRCSAFYRTPAFPKGSGPNFINAVAEVTTDEPPHAILRRLHAIEEEFGRIRRERWAPRSLDLDLLASGNQVLPDADTQDKWRELPFEQQRERAPASLVLPHPRLQERAFVLVPWADMAPDWRHPRTGLSVVEMLERLPASDRAAIRPVGSVG